MSGHEAHLALVQGDPETGLIQVKSTSSSKTRDSRGPVLGSAAQGIGNALCEELTYDAEGQWLTGSLMDSLVPTALEMPASRIAHTEPLLLASLAA